MTKSPYRPRPANDWLKARVLIAGGGIGGLALALSLHDAGIRDIKVFEAASEMKELGVGINLLPHAVRELTELGLLQALETNAIPTGELVYFTKQGQHIWAESRGLAAGYHWPQFSIHRGELLMLLYRAVLERLGPERVHTGHRLSNFGQNAAGQAWAEFVDRQGGQLVARAHGDVLVGCDGIHSVVRQTFYPDEGPPKWNGITMWRGTTIAAPFLSGRSMIVAGPFGHRVVIYPISKHHEDQRQARINWVAEYATDDGRPVSPQQWDYKGRLADLLVPFESFSFDWLTVPELFQRAEEIYQYPMVDRDPLPRWSFGPVTLLGDAAHPMYPVGSNGASQAILDARVLARALALSPTVTAALATYEADRRAATAKIVLLNRQVGPEQCIEIVAERAPQGFERIEDVISQQELELIANRYKQATGFDRDVLNTRASLSVKRP